MNIELYISNRLCDIDKSLNIYLRRQFINPAELNGKDAQKSYEITLPATANNNDIFSYANVEEMQGKFRIYDNAKLYIGSTLVLDGKFRMSEITRDSYKGNLGIPAPITISDVFGNTTMNQAGSWLIPFAGVSDITKYNTGGHDKNIFGNISPCIFPLVLYGLLQKDNGNNNASGKDILDESVRFGLADFPPSVNCMHMLKQIFRNTGYNLSGNAISDDRLSNLFVSYKNENDYPLPFEYKKLVLSGTWTNYNEATETVENEVAANGDDPTFITCDMLKGVNFIPNILSNESNMFFNGTITIPRSGLYKIVFNAEMKISKYPYLNVYGSKDGIRVVEPLVAEQGRYNNLSNTRFEIKLVRNKLGGGNDLSRGKIDNLFYRDNIDQTEDVNGSIFPIPRGSGVNFIDPLQNSDLLCGFAWGTNGDSRYINPSNNTSYHYNPIAITGGYSWDRSRSNFRAYSAVNNVGYRKRVGSGFEDTNRFKVDLLNAPNTYMSLTYDYMDANGDIGQIVFLEEGETVSVLNVSDQVNAGYTYDGWLRHDVTFDLSIEPFTTNRNWITVDDNGASTLPMNWNDSFTLNQIDLIRFLPSNVKINDWIENFCKAFNLNLVNTGRNNFELNVKNNDIVTNLSNLIDLDKRANVDQRSNESLRLPYKYELGFTVDVGEYGYINTMDEIITESGAIERVVNSGDKGGGEFFTGSYESNIITQTSSFSYCWYKQLFDANKNPLIEVPVITDFEIWENEFDYDEMSNKFYFDKAQRFWYLSGTYQTKVDNVNTKVALVANEFVGNRRMILDYENKANSIMKNYFLLLVNSNNDYTIVNCYLSPEDYSKLDISLIKFNGDLYNVAEIDGYDPLGKSKGVLKLIRIII